MTRTTYIYDKASGKVIEKKIVRKSSTGIEIINELEPFQSPVDGSVVGNRRELRDHNKQHSVVDHREFKGHQYQKQELPPVAPVLAEVFKRKTGRF